MNDKTIAVYGLHAVRMLLQQRPTAIQHLYFQEYRQEERGCQALFEQAASLAVNIQTLPKLQLDQLTQQGVHQGVVAICHHQVTYSEADLQDLVTGADEPLLLLVLDGVQDPHNLGACIRSANALGAHAVIIPKDRAVGMTPVVRKVASGAAELTPLITVTNLARTLRWLKEQGVWLYGADEAASSQLFTMNFNAATALVLGAEGKGLRRLTKEICDELIQIPTLGAISSLNVSVAAGICLYEVMRQRGKV